MYIFDLTGDAEERSHDGRAFMSVYVHTYINIYVHFVYNSYKDIYTALNGHAEGRYGVATISRPIKIIGLFCRISSLL